MNILLVDDDRFVIASLNELIDWVSLGFEQVYTANNIDSAKEIIRTHPIHILLSDIDMPHGSGLDLLSWIRDNNLNIQVLFLTNYADFNYAQKALKLKSFDYFLKPLDFNKLTDILKKAISQIQLDDKVSKDASIAQLYQNNLDKICELFWQSFLTGSISALPTDLDCLFSQRHIPYVLEDEFYPILINTSSHTVSDKNEIIKIFHSSAEQLDIFKAAFFANLSTLLSPMDIFYEANLCNAAYLAIIKCPPETFQHLKGTLTMCLENYTSSLNKQYHVNIACFVGYPLSFSDFLPMFQQLKSMNSNILSCRNSVSFLEDYKAPDECYDSPNLDTLEFCLQSNDWQSFLNTSNRYLMELEEKNQLSAISINSYQIDIIQLLYSFFKSKGILAHKLFHGEAYSLLSANAKKSIFDMQRYLRYILDTASNYLDFSSSETSVAKLILEYIDGHYAEDIDRNCLADILYLDPDYASKLFKKETGISFGNYLISKRIAAAKNLLENTNFSVNTIADKVGYGNYSYFIRLFKKMTSFTPIEYRNLKK